MNEQIFIILPVRDFPFGIFPPNHPNQLAVLELLQFTKPIVFKPATPQKLTPEFLKDLEDLAGTDPQEFNRVVRATGIHKLVEEHEKKIAAKFFAPENLERIAQRENKPNFVAQLTAMRDRPQDFSDNEKRQMLQFVVNEYSREIGAPAPTVKLYNDPDNSNTNGYYGVGGNSVFINTASPNFADFAKTLGTAIHETTHCAQDCNPNIYGNPLFSRLFRANFRAYQNAEKAGYEAYKTQLVEVGAFAAGDAAEKAFRALPKKPNLGAFLDAAANSPIVVRPDTQARGRRSANNASIHGGRNPSIGTGIGAPAPV